ncbi:MAG: 6-bladed beta-propeller [Balneolaceae bacterium]|nr:6-bladed beta-propeller [Balneolaceae bacterium]
MITLLILVQACSSSPDFELPEEVASLENLTVIDTSVEEVPEMNPERVARFGDTDEVIIGQMGRVTVDDRGRVYITDRNRLVIHVYNSKGSHITEIGGEGDGPGEFRNISSVQSHGDFLHVMDGTSLRISRFRMDDFELVDDVVVPYEMNAEGGYVQYPSGFSVLDENRYLIHFGVGYSSGEDSADKPTITGRILNRTSGNFEEETIYKFPSNEALVSRTENSVHIMSTDYNRSSFVELNGDNFIIYGWSDDLLFKFYTIDGVYRRAIYVPYEKPQLSRNEVLAEYSDRDEPWISMVSNDEMPETWPAFDAMIPDDQNRIWISLFTDDEESYTWMVIDSESEEIVGTFTRSREWSLIEVRDGFMYARVTDEETGLMEVVKYGFDL